MDFIEIHWKRLLAAGWLIYCLYGALTAEPESPFPEPRYEEIY